MCYNFISLHEGELTRWKGRDLNPDVPTRALLCDHYALAPYFKKFVNIIWWKYLDQKIAYLVILSMWTTHSCNCILIWLKAMAPRSSTLAWKIPWMEEPGGLQSMGSLRVGHDWATSLSVFTFMHWRRKWQHTPVFLPGESQGWRSLVGCRLWGCTELDMTEET